MKNIWGNILCFIIGLTIPSLGIIVRCGIWDFTINIIDLLMLVSTVALSILVIFLAKRLEKKDIVRDIIIKELDELCDTINLHSSYLSALKDKKATIEETQSKVKMAFFNLDLLIDRINKQLEVSFSRFFKNNPSLLQNVTTPYYKWLTGGKLMEKDFMIDDSFIRDNNTELNKTISDIKLVIHQIIRFN